MLPDVNKNIISFFNLYMYRNNLFADPIPSLLVPELEI